MAQEETRQAEDRGGRRAQANARSRRRLLLCLGFVLLFLALLVLFRRHAAADGSTRADDRSGSRFSGDGTATQSFPDLAHDRRGSGAVASRAARGKPLDEGANSSWGVLVIESIKGNPQPGDLAYLARLGPDHGLMTVESVEGDKAVLNLGTLPPSSIRDGDTIETMPPRKE